MQRKSDGKVLLLHRSGVEGDGWGFPGGKVDEGDDLSKTIQNEMRQEMGSIPKGKLTGKSWVYKTEMNVGDYRVDLGEYVEEEGQTFEYHFFHFLVEDPTWNPKLNWEHDKFGWYDPDKLPKGLYKATNEKGQVIETVRIAVQHLCGKEITEAKRSRPVVTFDFDGVLNSGKLKPFSPDDEEFILIDKNAKLLRRLAKSHDVFIVTARRSEARDRIVNFAKINRLPIQDVFAMDGNPGKIAKVQQLKAVRHYDDNHTVVDGLNELGIRAVLVECVTQGMKLKDVPTALAAAQKDMKVLRQSFPGYRRFVQLFSGNMAKVALEEAVIPMEVLRLRKDLEKELRAVFPELAEYIQYADDESGDLRLTVPLDVTPTFQDRVCSPKSRLATIFRKFAKEHGYRIVPEGNDTILRRSEPSSARTRVDPSRGSHHATLAEHHHQDPGTRPPTVWQEATGRGYQPSKRREDLHGLEDGTANQRSRGSQAHDRRDPGDVARGTGQARRRCSQGARDR